MQGWIKLYRKYREEKFIDGRGLGNEISFYVFDYEPEAELDREGLYQAHQKRVQL